MKKLILILIIFIPIWAASQTTPDGKNWKHTGNNEFTKQLTIQTKTLTGAKITAYDSVVTQMADSVNLLDAIQALQFILAPKLTTAQINAISSPEEGAFVYDSSLHVFKFYNGTAWKTISND